MQKVRDQTPELILAACEHIGTDPSTVFRFRVDEALDQAYMILQLGIKGMPKHTFALSDLVALVEATKTAGSAKVAEKAIEVNATRAARKLADAEGVDLSKCGRKGKGKISISDVRDMIAGGK